MTNEELLTVLRSRYPSVDWSSGQDNCEVWLGQDKLMYCVQFKASKVDYQFKIADDDLETIFRFEDPSLERLLRCFDGWVRNLVSGFSSFLNVADNAEVSHAIAEKEVIRFIELVFPSPMFQWKKLPYEKQCVYRAKLTSEFDAEIAYDSDKEWTVTVWGFEDKPTIFFVEDEPEKVFNHLLDWLKENITTNKDD